MELPVEGYPEGAEAVREWFRKRHGREASAEELGAILNAMAMRDATPPRDPHATPSETGWRIWAPRASDEGR